MSGMDGEERPQALAGPTRVHRGQPDLRRECAQDPVSPVQGVNRVCTVEWSWGKRQAAARGHTARVESGQLTVGMGCDGAMRGGR